MRVAFVTGGRSAEAMGLEAAELQLIRALRLRDGVPDVRVVGGRAARAYAERIDARWYPALRGRSSPLAWTRADVVHLAGLSLPPPRKRPFLATFYDLSPLHYGDEGELPPWTAESAGSAERVLCTSEFTASEVVRHLAVPRSRITVFSQAPCHDLSPRVTPLSAAELARLGIAAPFVLRIGGYTRRKNFPLLLAAWPEIRRRTGASLVLAGPPQPARNAALTAAPSLAGVSVLDYLPRETVPRLIRAAAVLVSTSRYEGFGLPVLEAMAAGVPAVAVRAPFTEEVAGESALLVADDPAAVADAVVRVLTDATLAATLAAAGPQRASLFSWSRSAELVHAAYRDALDGRASTSTYAPLVNS